MYDMNGFQRQLLDYFKEASYPLNPLSLCDLVGEEPYIVRRNVFYLVQQGFLEHKGYLTQINGLRPLYQITEKGLRTQINKEL